MGILMTSIPCVGYLNGRVPRVGKDSPLECIVKNAQSPISTILGCLVTPALAALSEVRSDNIPEVTTSHVTPPPFRSKS